MSALPPITHPEKVLFPDDGISKAELAAYYQAVAPLMLPHLRGRPVTMERFPSGIGAKGFIQKDVSKGFPAWLERVEVPHKDSAVHYVLANDERALQWIANQNTITLHVWASRAPKLEHPDVCVIDLDPSRDDQKALREAMRLLHAILDELKQESFVKTSGSKGYHVVVPLGARATWKTCGTLAHQVAEELLARGPELFTQEFAKADRQERIYVDVGRNRPGATFAAAYTVRPKPGAPVSAPCTWEEVASGKAQPQTFTLKTMAKRLDAVGDLWADLGSR